MIAHLFVVGMTVALVLLLAVNAFRMLLLILAVPELWSNWQLSDDEYFFALLGTDALPPISVISTTRDAESSVVQLAHTLLGLEYPRHEVVLVDDGSHDATLQRLIEAFDLAKVSPAFTVSIPTRPVDAYYRSRTHTRLLVIRKERGGAADALNAGCNASRYPLVLAVGMNVTFETDALLRLARPFLLNKSVQATAGIVRISNGGAMQGGRFVPVVGRNWFAGVQTVAHLRSFMFERLGWNRIASNLVFPGSLALMRREHLLGIKGFRTDIEGPAMDMTIRLQRYLADRGINPRLLVIPDPVAWSRVPDTVEKRGEIVGSRIRGLARTLAENKGMCLNPEYGLFGVITVPFYWLGEIIAPVVELLGYVGLIAGVATGLLSRGFVDAYLGAVIGFSVLLSLWTAVLEALTFDRYSEPGDMTRLLFYALVESFGFRQLMMWFRVRAYFTSSPKLTPTSNGQLTTSRTA